jgi:sterol-4alpha-carboxylate 3-dehydrogenase (decarboxylating)
MSGSHLNVEWTPRLILLRCRFLGSHLVLALLHSPSYSSVSIISRTIPNNRRHAGALYYAGDLTKEYDVRSLLDRIRPRVIFHAASPSPNANKKSQNHTNVLGTEVLLKCAAESPFVHALVYTSCDEAIEIDLSNHLLTEETAKLHTKKSNATPYQKSKALAEQAVINANSWSLRTLCLRLPPIYGGGDLQVIPSLLEMMNQGKSTLQIGPNKKLFEHVYIDNAVHAHLLAAKVLLLSIDDEGFSIRVDGETFFITDDSPMPWYDFARKVWYAAGDRTEPEWIRVVPMHLALTTARVNDWVSWTVTLGRRRRRITSEGMTKLGWGTHFSIEKAREWLGYEPLVPVEEGIRRAVEKALEGADEDRLVLRGKNAS